MSLAQQMIVVSPADGPAPLSAEQRNLLIGKAKWIRTIYENGLKTAPTIAITRAAWQALLQEKADGAERLRTAWVTTLFRLVDKGSEPPPLVVRTSAPSHVHGLARAQKGVAPPKSEAEAVERKQPLARAIEQAFASYGQEQPVWADHASEQAWLNQIVVVQAEVSGDLFDIQTRDSESGELAPTPHGNSVLPKGHWDELSAIVETLDSSSGKLMVSLVAQTDRDLIFMSARSMPASAEVELASAVDRAERGVWSTREAVNAVDPRHISTLLHPRLARNESISPLAKGLGVAHGAAAGQVVFSSDDAARLRARGIHAILVMTETGPTDVEGMHAATGILTARGGMTSHAAVVARVVGKPCVAGLRSLEVDQDGQECRIGEKTFRAGDQLTINGSDGSVYAGSLPLAQPDVSGAVSRLLDWSDGARTIAVRTNVETVEAAETALHFGAEGIGLARSETYVFLP